MTPQNPIVIQEGLGSERALVYLLHVGDARPSERYPLGTFDAIREACGPEPMIVVRSDDGTAGALPIVDAGGVTGRSGFEVSRIVAGGWSAGVRGIRRFLLEAQRGLPSGTPMAWARQRLAGIVAADGLHAPWTSKPADRGPPPRGLSLGPSEVFRDHVARARTPCNSCKGRGWNVGDCHPREVCGACDGVGAGFAFVLTHCMQDYMETPHANPRYLSTSTVARELTGWACVGGDAGQPTLQHEGRLAVISYPGPNVDYAGHVRQQREALPAGLATMRAWGLFQP